VLGAFAYRPNEAVLHTDASLMPRRRRVWSSWNYAAEGAGNAPQLSVTYWMNRLQGIPDDTPLFVTLNPLREPAEGSVIRRDSYDHPVFDTAAMAAQARLWSLQGERNTWFCGAYFGAGFHEDGLQAGLAVAEQLGGVRRPWEVADESGRIQITPLTRPAVREAA
jgi:predicted NAD/FAD-binding protein